jgi:3-hydroxybutyryl-CoA dehydratase
MSGGGQLAPPRPWGRAGAWMRPFDELEVGEAYVSRRRTITETDVVRFAGMTGAMSPAFGDPERYGGAGCAAPDLLPLTYSIGLIPNDYIRALRRILDLELHAPVCCGDTIHVEAEIVRLEPWTDDYGLAAGAWRIVKQDGTVATTVELEAIWLRRPD